MQVLIADLGVSRFHDFLFIKFLNGVRKIYSDFHFVHNDLIQKIPTILSLLIVYELDQRVKFFFNEKNLGDFSEVSK